MASLFLFVNRFCNMHIDKCFQCFFRFAGVLAQSRLIGMGHRAANIFNDAHGAFFVII